MLAISVAVKSNALFSNLKITERAFLNFLKDKAPIKGIELYKIKENGTVQKKVLNTVTKKVDSNDCV